MAKIPTTYNREQIGHSIIKSALLCMTVVGLVPVVYWVMSPRHYFHL